MLIYYKEYEHPRIGEIMQSSSPKPGSIRDQIDFDVFASEIVIKTLIDLGFALEKEQIPFGEPGFTPRVDFIFSRDGENYAVEVKHSRKSHLVFMHLLPRAILLLQAVNRISGFLPIVAVVVEQLSNRDIQRMASHMDFYAPQVGWLFIDRNENIVFKDIVQEQYQILKRGKIAWQGKVPPVDVNISPYLDLPPQSASYSEFAEASVPYLNQQLSFSDSEQWLLKVLLLGSRNFKPSYWGGPIGNAANAFQLSKLANVSPPVANSFVTAMESSGYLRKVGRKKMILLSPGTLLEEWRGKYRLHDNWIFPYRSAYPILDFERFFEEILADIKHVNKVMGPLAITAHQACRLYKVKHSSAKSIHIYFWGDRHSTTEALNLVPAEGRGDADLFLIKPKYPKSVFRGKTKKKGIPICDILQCYLDLFHLPDRGEEQANLVYETIISGILNQIQTQMI